ncbi:MAG: MFS transporter [Prevotellaceae bacterium]|nr:MFS transporter [Prevotellaceae bacterium]
MWNKDCKLSLRLSVMSFLEYAVWGAYLCSMGGYLAGVGLGGEIRWFYCVQGVVALFMPALVGAVADRWMEGRSLLSLLHALSGGLMTAMCCYGSRCAVSFPVLWALYALSVVCFLPTIALSNAVAFSLLGREGRDIKRSFPPIRVWGTVGFVVSMWAVDLAGWQLKATQFGWSGFLGLLLAAYALTLPRCRGEKRERQRGAPRVNARMLTFLVFSVLAGFCLHVSNAYASPFLHSFGLSHANLLISLSQVSEALCLLLIPVCFKRLGIKAMVLIALAAWALRFALFTGGVWLIALSMLVYGVAFDFFNVCGSMYVAEQAGERDGGRMQGLFMMMTSGAGASLGMLAAGSVVNRWTVNEGGVQAAAAGTWGWTAVWLVFALYAVVVAVAFALLFRQ